MATRNTGERSRAAAAVAVLRRREGGDRIGARGRSMGHLMKDACRLLLDRTNTRYEIGDLVAFHGEEGLLVHRIVGRITKRGHDLYATKGDGLRFYDPGPVHPSLIVGTVTRVESGGRALCTTTRTARRLGRAIAWLSRWEARATGRRWWPGGRLSLRTLAAHVVAPLARGGIWAMQMCLLLLCSRRETSA